MCRQVRFKTLHKLLGLVSYLDWIMIIVTTLATISQLVETPHYRVMNNPELQVADYVFVTAMAVELSVKILAEGLIFTPNALLRDISGMLDVLIFSVNLVWVWWMPGSVEPSSAAQMFMILRCFRPLRDTPPSGIKKGRDRFSKHSIEVRIKQVSTTSIYLILRK